MKAPVRLGALRLLLPYLRPYTARVIGASVALLLAAGLVLALGQGVRRLIDRGFASAQRGAARRRRRSVMFAVVAALAAATTSAASTSCRGSASASPPTCGGTCSTG